MACTFSSTLPVASKLLNQEMSQCLFWVKWGVGVKFGIGHFQVTARFMHLMHAHDIKWHSIYTDKQSLHNEGQIWQVEYSMAGCLFQNCQQKNAVCVLQILTFLSTELIPSLKKATQFVPPPTNQLTIHCLNIWYP